MTTSREDVNAPKGLLATPVRNCVLMGNTATRVRMTATAGRTATAIRSPESVTVRRDTAGTTARLVGYCLSFCVLPTVSHKKEIQDVLKAGTGRTVPRSANASTEASVTRPRAPVSVLPASLELVVRLLVPPIATERSQPPSL